MKSENTGDNNQEINMNVFNRNQDFQKDNLITLTQNDNSDDEQGMHYNFNLLKVGSGSGVDRMISDTDEEKVSKLRFISQSDIGSDAGDNIDIGLTTRRHLFQKNTCSNDSNMLEIPDHNRNGKVQSIKKYQEPVCYNSMDIPNVNHNKSLKSTSDMVDRSP